MNWLFLTWISFFVAGYGFQTDQEKGVAAGQGISGPYFMNDFFKKNSPVSDTAYHFLNNREAYHTLDEVIQKRFNGKKVYVDVWATWCGPCIEEFGYNEQLRKLLAEYDTEILYISVDRPEREKQWKQMISHFNLEGYHLRVNDKLAEDLRNLYGNRDNSVQIPWYLLFDKKGKMKHKYAYRPSELKALAKVLKKM